ncbi:hemin uptake protein HemP [Yoonia sp. SDW83-1]|uniref:hemin uptake protein HemP n=1 Tax=Yoonia sp. SDW83-1 TaxID=3366945 RepID=UPI00398C6710
MSIHTMPARTDQPSPNLPVYDAEVLTEGGDLAHIVLGEQVYTLRITRAGKLILTK